VIARQLLYCGDPRARVCIFGRDLGSQEILWRQPLVGPSGQRVRRAVLDALGRRAPDGDDRLDAALRYVFLTNSVPLRPPRNRPFSRKIIERHRPAVEELLARTWHGDVIVTLGADALRWFAPYCARGEVSAFWRRTDRFRSALSCVIPERKEAAGRRVDLLPLPHPSPASVLYASRFAALFAARRLERLLAEQA
jgi:uracil-DNA glycosylase